MKTPNINIKTFLLPLTIIVFFASCNEKHSNQYQKTKKPVILTRTSIKKDSAISREIVPEASIDKNFVLGKFNYRKNKNFVKIKPVHASKTIYLNKETYHAFEKMYHQAEKDGINLKIVSGTRSFYEQKNIWERKWQKYNQLKPIDRAKKILQYSSMPTTSRHHWGTDIDLNNLNNSYFEKGKGKIEYEWLVAHANSFGFYQVYTGKKNGRTGYTEEKWHWSYLPLAREYLKFYNENITYKDIKGFKGAKLAKELKIIDIYVNGVSKKIKN